MCWAVHPVLVRVLQASARKALRYSVRGKHRRVLIRRLGAPGSPITPRGSPAMRRKLRLRPGGSPAAGSSGAVRKRLGASRLGRKPRAKALTLPPQIYCTEFCRCGGLGVFLSALSCVLTRPVC